MIRGRSVIAVFAACALALVCAVPAYTSYSGEADRIYTVASRRLTKLKSSPQIKKFRSYWLDCIRNFELVEKKHPRSPRAGDACFDRAEIYGDLYRHSGYSKDSDEAIRIYGACRTAYPGHARTPEALYRIIELAHGRRKGGDLADEAYSRPVKSYPRSRWTIRAKTRMKPSAAKIRRKAPVSPARGRANPAGVVRKIRYRSGGDYTRVVIDHEHKVEYHVRELKNPDRLVFDLLNTRLGSSVDGEPLMVNDGILQQVRASQYAPSIVRVVLDLAVIKSYAVFPLRDPGRLVIDVTGVASDGSGTAVEPTADPGSGSIPQFAHTRAVMAPEAKNGDGLSLSRQLGLKVRTIAIDAGHGGRDPGAIGRRGTKEKDLTLDIAKRLALLVKEGLGCNVVMTRDRDEFIPLEDRPAIARTRGADLFVSIHINASRRSGVRGIETYIQGLSASDRDAMETAARENATTAKTLSELDDELTKILTGLRMESNDEDSIQLAHAVHGSLVAAAKPVQGHVADLGVKRAFFYVLINTGMPSILAEVGFISNPTEEKLMKKGSYRQSIAEAVYRGVKKYVDAREPQREGT